MHEQQVDFQLVPPHMHRRNAAERAIRTFKSHFIAGLCSTDPQFPLLLWDRLIPQAEITLNLLRGSRINPNLSAWAQLYGTFDFNRTPLAPPGQQVVAHVKPAERDSWEPHGMDGWYIGPALESYRCYIIWIWETRSERICDTVSWFPKQIKMPTPSTNELILASLNDIKKALTNPATRAPVPPIDDTQASQLKQLTDLLTNMVQHDPKSQPSNQPPPVPIETEAAPAKDDAPALRVDVPSPLPKQTAPALRVAETPPPNEKSAQVTPANKLPSAPLRVEQKETAATANDKPEASAPTQTLPQATEEPAATLRNSTGPRTTSSPQTEQQQEQ